MRERRREGGMRREKEKVTGRGRKGKWESGREGIREGKRGR